MTRIAIFDRVDTPMGLPLGHLVRAVRQRFPATRGCLVTRSRGYGLPVNAWYRALNDVDHLAVEWDVLEGLCLGGEEWFYDLEATTSGVRFGLHDSTALFVEGDAATVQALAASFSDVRPRS